MMKHQQGSTLIIVLVILLLVTIIGTMAIRSGILGLRVATNSQIQSLLFESSNAALFNLEDQSRVKAELSQDGMYGYFNAADVSSELVFCYRADNEKFFSMDKASTIDKDGIFTKSGINGFCTRNSFATGRTAILTQVYLYKGNIPSTPLTGLVKGTSVGVSTLPVIVNNMSVTVISVLPSFSGASSDDVKNCFRKTSIKKTATTETVDECFSKLNIAYDLQRADYNVGGAPKLL